MKKYFLMLALIGGLLTGCSKADEAEKKPLPDGPDPAPAPIPEDKLIEAGKAYPLSPEVGGPNEPNQVYVDLSSGKMTSVRRDTWDLAFYCGDDFRVILNSSIAMTVKETPSTDIHKFVAPDTEILFSDDPRFPSRKAITDHLIDDPRGILQEEAGLEGTGTAIARVSEKEEENKVYLLNLGNEISTTTPEIGGINLQGAHRGFMKVRITRNGNGYQLSYAKNDELKDIKTVTISKDPEYNFVFLSLTTGQQVQVQPKKKNWDLCFSPSTSWFSTQKEKIGSPFNSATFFPDMIISNLHGQTKATIFESSDKSEEKRNAEYTAYTKEKALKIDFSKEKYNSQMVIGRNWRDNQGGALIRNELYYLIKDGDGNYFKLKILAMKNDKGERGYPSFEYELLK
nr:HmuY family protein [uncultured Capnocytophaga sp.]